MAVVTRASRRMDDGNTPPEPISIINPELKGRLPIEVPDGLGSEPVVTPQAKAALESSNPPLATVIVPTGINPNFNALGVTESKKDNSMLYIVGGAILIVLFLFIKRKR